MKIRFAIFATVLLLASLACSVTATPTDTPAEPAQPVQEEPAAPEPAPEPSPLPGPEIVFEDDFSNTNSGWDRGSDDDSMTDYENGAYRIQVNASNLVIWANPGLEYVMPSDIRIDVDATKTGGTDNNDFGVMCRLKWVDDNPNFYYFILSSDGYAGIVLVKDGSQNIISPEGSLLEYGQIRQGDATNHITAECIGDQLKLYANDILIVTATDSTLTEGDVGLIASTYEDPGTDILFDNFVVTKP